MEAYSDFPGWRWRCRPLWVKPVLLQPPAPRADWPLGPLGLLMFPRQGGEGRWDGAHRRLFHWRSLRRGRTGGGRLGGVRVLSVPEAGGECSGGVGAVEGRRDVDGGGVGSFGWRGG